MTGAPYPVFPVKLVGFQELHAASLMKAAHMALFGTAYRKYGYLPKPGRYGAPVIYYR
jgi:hypothetical protein